MKYIQLYEYSVIYFLDTTINISTISSFATQNIDTGSVPARAVNQGSFKPATPAANVSPDLDLDEKKLETEVLERDLKTAGDADTPFHSEALEKLLEKVTKSLEKEFAQNQDTSEASAGESEARIDPSQMKTLGLIIQKYAGKELSFTEWSGLYQELQTEGFDISKPLLDVLL